MRGLWCIKLMRLFCYVAILYCLIFRWSCWRYIPRAEAAREIFPLDSRRAAAIVSFSTEDKASFRRVAACRGLGCRSRLPQRSGQVGRQDLRGVGKGDGALDDVLQLPDISGIGVLEQDAHGLAADALDQDVLSLGRMLLDKMLCQEGNILHALPERRQMDIDDVQTVKKVFPEGAPLARGLQVAVGRGNEPQVHLELAHAADPHDLAFLQHPQDLGLEQGRNVADLVEEDRAAVGLLQQPLFLILRAGEGALLEAEQLRFEQRVGDGAAVDRHEGLLVPRAPAVDRPGDQFLAGAALAGDQHIAFACRRLLDEPEDLLHGRAVADDLVEAVLVAQDPFLMPGDHFGQGLRR